MPLFWVMMSIAAAKGLYQLIRNPSYWEKTFHGLANPPKHAEACCGAMNIRDVQTPCSHGRLNDRRCKQIGFVLALLLYWPSATGCRCGTASSSVTRCHGCRPPRACCTAVNPHLAAIGFIFTPLTAMVDLPGC